MTESTVFDTPAQLGETLAIEIANGITAAMAERRPYVLGCPGGRSPRPVYAALATQVRLRKLDLSRVVVAMMDEYVESVNGRYRNVDPAASYSCAGFAAREIAGPLARAAGPGRGPSAVWVPDAADPDAHEQRLHESGIDLFILASGASDGHVAFNPPGTHLAATSRVVELPETTRRDNVATFPQFGRVENVPHFGVTVGPATIVANSARAVMVVHGIDKRVTAARLLNSTTYDESWPATVLHACHHPSLYLDTTATRPGAGPE
ncbi:6-phosphogluconolactonase [Segeticoccus rhizosphaerae]|jgi:glucosamine-6-phosphate deaminase|uniref:6-phosphogluconolactonase n=1 Tax=Segeticoccus rhizosphaerae TaxID=1104777 RepID=UPI0010BFDF81|nr:MULTISPECIES: 6-phosphogluconolactonase [Intrasporangiaceae]